MKTQWTADDPETGEKAFYSAEYFAKKWTFRVKVGRRYSEWRVIKHPPKAMWQIVLDYVRRAYARHQASPEQVREMELLIRQMPEDDEPED